MAEDPIPPPLQDLRKRLRQIIRAQGHGPWRSPDDLLDHAWDLMMDRVVQKTAPTTASALLGWGKKICLNLARSGPPRIELSSRRVSKLADAAHTGRETGRSGEKLRRHETFNAIERRLRPLLTAAEHRALDALLTTPTMAEAARQAGMSPRDLRVRLRRIEAKARRLLQE